MMKLLYEAGNTLEAHMVLDLLRQQGLAGRIDGEFLQGGIGDLPAAGLVRVMVDEADYEHGRQLVAEWDSAQPATPAPAPPAAPEKRSRAWPFAAGLALGLAAACFYYRVPVDRRGVDFNHDGVLDERWDYAGNGMPLAGSSDRNLDGKTDARTRYKPDGTVESGESDDDFDGAFESSWRYRLGQPDMAEIDTDKDGFRDLRLNFKNGVMVSQQHLFPTTGMPQKIDYFSLGKMTHSEVDSDADGTMDARVRYNAMGEAAAAEPVR